MGLRHDDILVLAQNGLRKHGVAAKRQLEDDVVGRGGQRGVTVGDAVRALHVGFLARHIGRFKVPLVTHRALVLSTMLGEVAVLPILYILPRKLVFLALPF